MSQHTPPEWAIDRAKELHRAEGGATVPMAHAFARYIAEHEEAPVDPLLIEARDICGHYWLKQGNPTARDIAKDYVSGIHDEDDELMDAVLSALRRGIEIGTPA